MNKKIIRLLTVFLVFLLIFNTVTLARTTAPVSRQTKLDMFLWSVTKSNVAPIDNIAIENIKTGKRVDIQDLKKIKNILFRLNACIVKEKTSTNKLAKYDYQVRLKNGAKQIFNIKFGNEITVNGKSYEIVKPYMSNKNIESYITWAEKEAERVRIERWPSSSQHPPEMNVTIAGVMIEAIMGTCTWTWSTDGKKQNGVEVDGKNPIILVQKQKVIPTVKSGATFDFTVDFLPATFQVYIFENNSFTKCELNGNRVTISEHKQQVVYCIHAQYKQGDAYYYFAVNVED